MEITEKELEDIIYNTNNMLLYSRGLIVAHKKIRQVRIGNYGIADIVSYCRPIYKGKKLIRKGLIQVIELKKDEINNDTFFQALSYIKGIKLYLQDFKEYNINDIDFKMILIGKTVQTKGSFTYLPSIYPIDLYTYQITFNGLYFNCQDGFCLTNPGF